MTPTEQALVRRLFYCLDDLHGILAELMAADGEVPDDKIHRSLYRGQRVLKELVVEARQKGWEL